MIKIILISILSTLAITVLVVSIFLNSILGFFGLVSTSIDTLINLQENKQILDVVKKRHKDKELKVSKRFIKQSSKKAAASAVSAATLGTAAVVITVVGLEVIDYCDKKHELQEESNILFKTNDDFVYANCMSSAKDDSEIILISIKNAVPVTIRKSWDATKSISRATWEKSKEISISTWQSASTTAETTWDTTSSSTNKSLESLIDWASKLTR